MKQGVFSKFLIVSLLFVSSLFADGNLSDQLPSTFLDDGVWKAVGMAIIAVAAIKGVTLVFRLIKKI